MENHFDILWNFNSPQQDYTEENLRKIFSKYLADYNYLKKAFELPEMLDLMIKETWLWRWDLTKEEENFIRRAYGNLHKGSGAFMFEKNQNS